MALMIAPGFLLKKLKLVGTGAVGALSAVLLYVCQPFLTIKSFVVSEAEASGALAINMLIMLGLSFLVHIVAFLILRLIFFAGGKLKKSEVTQEYKLRTGAMTFCGIFCNAGFMGIPFVEQITGSGEAVIYAVVFMCAFNALMWTLGIYIITGDIKKMKPLRGILNPAVIVLTIALPVFFIPGVKAFVNEQMNPLVTGIKYLGDATLPVSMLIAGIRMGELPVRTVFNDWRLYVVSGVKLLILPGIILTLMLPFLLTGVFGNTDPGNRIITALVIMAALPAAASAIALSERFGGDAPAATRGFLLTTILSVITLPAVLTLIAFAVG